MTRFWILIAPFQRGTISCFFCLNLWFRFLIVSFDVNFHCFFLPNTKRPGVYRDNYLTLDQHKPLVKSMHALLVLLHVISGNIHPNLSPKYPCGICSKNVNINQKDMECKNCLPGTTIDALTRRINFIKCIWQSTNLTHGFVLSAACQTSPIQFYFQRWMLQIPW